MDWRIKAIVQKGLSICPGGGRINTILQRNVGTLTDFESAISARISQDWTTFTRETRKLGIDPNGLRIVEIGTGWFPLLPVCNYLAGVRKCITFDIERKLTGSWALEMIPIIAAHSEEIARVSGRPLSDVNRDLQTLGEAVSLEDLLARARIEYMAPFDSTRMGLPDQSIDIVFSNNVLQHVETQLLGPLMTEIHRVLRTDGMTVHSVACRDHWTFCDPNISAINYLKYTTREWSFWNSRIQYQNRLRPQDFIAIAENAGLEIILHKAPIKPELQEELKKMRIAPEFRQYPEEQLCISSMTFAAAPGLVGTTNRTPTGQGMPASG